MKNCGTQTIKTPRLVLRRFRIADVEPFYRNMASDRQALKYLTWSAHKNTYITKNSIERWIADTEAPNSYIWCIELAEIGEAIGSILVTRLNEKDCIARVGYYIGSAFWNNGYVTEALRAVIEFLFDRVGVVKIECEYDVTNIASGRVMEKCSMKLERLRKRGAVNNSGLCDTAICSIFYSDYEKAKDGLY